MPDEPEVSTNRTYSLTELADRSGTTARTVRYYIQQGLLRSPGAGSTARYDEGHLTRLQAIRRLQREHLPLAEIRRRLEGASDEEVDTITSAHAPDRASALHYVRSLLRHDEPAGESPPPAPSLAAPMPRLASRVAEAPPDAYASKPDRSQWERIALTPDVELHIRRPLTRQDNRRVDRLISIARQLLEEDPS